MVHQHPNPSETTSGAGGASDRAGLSRGLVTTLIALGLLAVFVAQNRQDVTLTFLVWSFTWPLWLFTLIAAALGALVWIGLGVLRRHRRRVARRAARD
jgi:uncharacterized integral membrane protein